MKNFLRFVEKFCRAMDWIGGTVLICVMLLVCVDVVLRYFRRPILGTYEIVSLAGAVIMGCAMPLSSWSKTHVTVDMLLGGGHPVRTVVFQITTRIMGMIFFAIAGYSLMDVGTSYISSHESTLSLMIPLYPFAYLLGFCCFAECLILTMQFLTEILRVVTKEGTHE